MTSPFHSHDERAFTILEILIVLTLIAVFATIAVSRQPSTNVTLKSQVTALQSHIRYAQMRAMNTDDAWGIVFDPDRPSYALFKGSTDGKRLLPGEDAVDVDLRETGIVITLGAEAVAETSFYFDAWGRPENNDGYLLSDLNIQLNNHGQSDTVAITPETGFVK